MSINSQNKLDIGRLAKQIAADINKLNTFADDTQRTYFGKGFNSGGSDEIIDSDFYVLIDDQQPDTEDNRSYIVNITAAQVGDMVNFSQQLEAWLNNAAPLVAFWQTTIDQVRDV